MFSNLCKIKHRLSQLVTTKTNILDSMSVQTVYRCFCPKMIPYPIERNVKRSFLLYSRMNPNGYVFDLLKVIKLGPEGANEIREL